MKLKEYATRIKNKLIRWNQKTKVEEKDYLSEKITERTQEAVEIRVIEASEELDREKELREQLKEERNIKSDAIKLATVTRGLDIDSEWTEEEMLKAISEYSGLQEEEVTILVESTTRLVQEVGQRISKMVTEAFTRIKLAFEQLEKEIKESLPALKLRKQVISNNKRKLKGMTMIRIKAFEKAKKMKGESLEGDNFLKSICIRKNRAIQVRRKYEKKCKVCRM